MQYAGGDNATHFEFWEKHFPGKEIPNYSETCSNCKESIRDNFFLQDQQGSFSVIGECCLPSFLQIDTFAEGMYKDRYFSDILRYDPGYFLYLETLSTDDKVIQAAVSYLQVHREQIPPHFSSGKYRGRSYESVIAENTGYFSWIQKEKENDPNYTEAIEWFKRREKVTSDIFTSGKYIGVPFEKVFSENPGYFKWLKTNGKMSVAVEWYTRNHAPSTEEEEKKIPLPVLEKENLPEGALNFGKHMGKTIEEIWIEDKPYLNFIVKKLDYKSSRRFLIENTCDFLLQKMGKGDGTFSTGKYKGKTYEQVLEENESYFTWIRDAYTGKGEDFIRAWIWYLRR